MENNAEKVQIVSRETMTKAEVGALLSEYLDFSMKVGQACYYRGRYFKVVDNDGRLEWVEAEPEKPCD